MVLQSKHRRCQSLILIHLIAGLCSTAMAQLAEGNMNVTEGELPATLNTLMDSVLADLTLKYDSIEADDFWHPFDFGIESDEEKVSPAFRQFSDLFSTFKTISGRMNTWREIVSKAEGTLSKRINTDGDNAISGDWSVSRLTTDDLSVEGRDARSDSIFNTLKFGNVDWTEDDFDRNSDILNRMSDMEKNILFVRSELSHALLKSVPGAQVVTSEVTMHGLITCLTAEIQKYSGDRLWNLGATDLFNNLAHKQSNVLQVEGGLRFRTVRLGELHARTINTEPVENVARLSADNEIGCGTAFKKLSSADDIHVSRVNQRGLRESVVMAENVEGFQFLDGFVAYEGAITENQLPFEDVILSSEKQTVSATVALDEVEVEEVLVGSINLKDLKDFFDRIVFQSYEDKIAGVKTFSTEPGVRKLFLGAWNGIPLPNAFFSPTEAQSVVLNGAKSFQNLDVVKLNVRDQVDGVSTVEFLSLTGMEATDSTWVFNGATRIEKDMRVGEEVDGISMDSLVHRGLLQDSTNTFEPNADVIFKQPVQVENLRVKDTINGKRFEELFGHLLLFEGDRCSVPARTQVLGDVVFSDVFVHDGKINALPIHHFLTKDTAQDISSPSFLSGRNSFHELLVLRRFDSVRVLDVLSKAMRISEATSSTVPWSVHFQSISCEGELIVAGPVSAMSDYKIAVARTRGIPSQTFLSDVILTKPTLKTLSTDRLTLDPGHTIQNVEVDVWNTSRVTLSKPSFLAKPFIVRSIVCGSLLDATGVNDVPTSLFDEGVFRKNRARQEFTGRIVVVRAVTVLNGDVHFQGTLDEFFVDDYVQHGFPLEAMNEQPIAVGDSWRFRELGVSDGLQTGGTNVCGVNLDRLLTDSQRRDSLNSQVAFSGEKRFNEPLKILRSLTSPQINDKRLERLFLLREESQGVTDLATFAAPIGKQRLQVNSINGVDMSWLTHVYSFEQGQHILNHDVRVVSGLRTSSLSVTGAVNVERLNDWLQNGMKLSDQRLVFEDEIVFENRIRSGGNANTEVYNNINVDDLFERVVMVTDNLNLESATVPGSIDAGRVEMGDEARAGAFGDGVDWNVLRENAIRLDDIDMDVELLVFDETVVNGPISLRNLNGVATDEFARLDAPQQLGTWKVEEVVMNGSRVEVKERLGRVNIQNELRDTLMGNGDSPQRLPGTTQVTGAVRINGNLDCVGLTRKDQVLTSRENLAFSRPLEFTELVTVKQISVSKGMVGHSVNSIFSSAFLTDSAQEQTIRSEWEFLGPVTFRENVFGRSVGENPIQSLVHDKEHELERAQSKVALERNRFKRTCIGLNGILNKLETTPVKLDSFELHQTLVTPAEARNVLVVGEDEDLQLLLHTANCQLHRYASVGNGLFDDVADAAMHIGAVDAWASFNRVVVMAKTLSPCSTQSGLFAMVSGTEMISTRISSETAKSFKLIQSEVDGQSPLLFTIFAERPREMDVYEWKGEQFVQRAMMRFPSDMDGVDLSWGEDGVEVVTHSRKEMHVYHYFPSGEHRVLLHASREMMMSASGPITLFREAGHLFGVVPENGGGDSLIQRTCNFQVIRVSQSGRVDFIQKLELAEVLSIEKWSFAGRNFLAFLSKAKGLSVYKFMGVNGLQRLNSPVTSFDGFKLTSFLAKTSSFSPQPLLVSLASNKVEVLTSNVFGDRVTRRGAAICDAAEKSST